MFMNVNEYFVSWRVDEKQKTQEKIICHWQQKTQEEKNGTKITFYVKKRKWDSILSEQLISFQFSSKDFEWVEFCFNTK